MSEGHDDSGTRRHAPDAGSGFMALPDGTRLGGRYTIDHVIAHGGFGITYGARHEQLGRVVAIKEHFPRQFAYRDGASSSVRPSDPKTFTWALDRFLQEGRALVACEHANVVRVTDIFEENGTAYMVLAYETGASLKNWLDRLGRPPTQTELDRIAAPLLDALHYVHGQGLLHRDIAPDNIMIRQDGTPCLIDFGAARQAIAERSQAMSAIVKTGYSPPEQYTSSGRAQGPWSDIYALGATLYRAVTGQLPVEATERMLEETLPLCGQAVAAPGAYRTSFLEGIDCALRLKAAERPQSVALWRDQLLGAATVVRPPSATEVPRPSAPPVTPSLAAPAQSGATGRASNLQRWLAFAGIGVVALGSMMALSYYPRTPAPAATPDAPIPAVSVPVLPPATSPPASPASPEPNVPAQPAAAPAPGNVPAPAIIFTPPAEDIERKRQLEALELKQRKAAADRKIAEDKAAQLKAEEETRKLAAEKAARLDATACNQLDEKQCKANAKCSWVASTVFIEGRPANPSFCGPVGTRQRGVTYRRE